jgi:hypothetical protein
MMNLYSRNLSRAVEFYSKIGFIETFRTPAAADPVHVELALDGFTLGIATVEAAEASSLPDTRSFTENECSTRFRRQGTPMRGGDRPEGGEGRRPVWQLALAGRTCSTSATPTNIAIHPS